MGSCACHPEKETSFMCMKHGTYLCDECLRCRDPKIYCKYRPSCPIWFMHKRQKGWTANRAPLASIKGRP
jgi:hypothetical protein